MSQTPPAANAPALEGQMFLFEKPELVTKDKHGSVGISRPARPFAFAEKIRAVPLTVSEIPAAARNYPVIFAQLDQPVPLAVLGLIDDENIFVREDGEWEEHIYIPGYLRRYPFALASDKQSDPNNPRMAIIVDRAYKGITEGGEFPFFENGEPSQQMKQAMEYCQQYERDRIVTTQFSERLRDAAILSDQVAQFTPEGGEPKPFAQYIGVDEKKLQELPDDKFLEMRKSNMLPLIYAQLMSMANWRAVMDRRARRHGLTGESVLQPLGNA